MSPERTPGLRSASVSPILDTTLFGITISFQMPTRFLWDHRPGHNVDHITAHGLTTDLWEAVFRRATQRIPDKDDAEVTTAEGRVEGRLYRIVYACDDETVLPLTILPLTILPITGFPIRRRGLR